MIVKFYTECSFVGSETVHIIEVEDDTTESELENILAELIEEDIQPDGGFEILEDDDPEIEEYGVER